MISLDVEIAVFVVLGAAFAGFTTGLAGFGTGLVASGFWFHVLPAPIVPPVIALGSVVGQWTGLAAVRRPMNWTRALPYLIGGVCGVPFGVALLAMTSPEMLRLMAGVLLVGYTVLQFSGVLARRHPLVTSRLQDGAVGFVGGILGGFAGLSGILPLIWLQLQGGPSGGQRAIYQPFNMVVLALSAFAMWLGGQFHPSTWTITALAVPGIVFGAWTGARFSTKVSEAAFRRFVLVLLLLSGLFLILRASTFS